MNRLLSRVGIRSASVGLLVAGTIGGIYLGQGREVQAQDAQDVQATQLVVQSNVDEMQLLKERHSQHAAARAYQRAAEGDAASKAATEAKAAAATARTLETKAIEKKETEKKEAEAKAEAEKAISEAESDSGSSSDGTTTPDVDVPASCDEFSGNRATGCALTLSAGFGLDQFSCLNKLWKKESGWNHKASNPSSGAYGIPQALPGSKMVSVASDWKTNPATQIKWGLSYIEGRYDTPCGAWSHSQSVGWY